MHDRLQVVIVLGVQHPCVHVGAELFLGDQVSFRIEVVIGIDSLCTVEAAVRQLEAGIETALLEGAVPFAKSSLAVGDVFFAEHFVECVPVGHLFLDDHAILDDGDHLDAILHDVVFVAARLFEATLEAFSKEVGGVGGDLTTKEVETVAEPVVDGSSSIE